MCFVTSWMPKWNWHLLLYRSFSTGAKMLVWNREFCSFRLFPEHHKCCFAILIGSFTAETCSTQNNVELGFNNATIWWMSMTTAQHLTYYQFHGSAAKMHNHVIHHQQNQVKVNTWMCSPTKSIKSIKSPKCDVMWSDDDSCFEATVTLTLD